MSFLSRLVLTDHGRSGRLTDYRGNRISTARLVRNGPRAFLSAIGRLAFGYLPPRPWISYDGQACIARFLDKSKTVLEFGSGMSTSWYAERAKSVVSLEDDPEWFERTHKKLSCLGNVEHRLCDCERAYVDLGGIPKERQFDLIMIDGTQRFKCLQSALPRLRSGGMLYLDNSDMHGDHRVGDIPAARAAIHAYAHENGLRVDTITDFAPTQLFVNEATVLRT